MSDKVYSHADVLAAENHRALMQSLSIENKSGCPLWPGIAVLDAFLSGLMLGRKESAEQIAELQKQLEAEKAHARWNGKT